MMCKDVVRFKQALFVGVFCCFLSFPLPANASAVPFHLCFEETEIFPNFIGAGADVAHPNPGLIIELLMMIDNEMEDVQIIFHRAAWSRCLKKLETGEYDAVIASYSGNRGRYAAFPMKNNEADKSRALSIADFCLFAGNNSDMSWQGDRFIHSENSTLAVPRGYSLVTLLDELRVSYELTFSSSLAIELLIGGRVDNAITLCTTGEDILTKHQARGLIKDIQIIRQQFAHLAVSKRFYQNHRKLVEKMWMVGARHRKESYQALVEKYQLLTP